MTRSKPPVSSFGPEILLALRAGAQGKVEIPFTTPNLAQRFMHRINSLRAAMKRESHPDADQLYSVGVHKKDDNPCIVVLAPRDSEFREAVQSLNTAETVVLTSLSSADEFLSSLGLENKPPEGENNT